MLRREAPKVSSTAVAALGREEGVEKLLQFFRTSGSQATVLTGAGISTESGIPDYRGPNGVYVRNKDFKPIQFQEFVSAHTYRQRYWARSFLGWPRILRSEPNDSHNAIAKLQTEHALISSVITQNVDRLHTKGGADNVVELHGSLYEVECTSCGHIVDRQDYQDELASMNPKVAHWASLNPEKDAGDVSSSVNPDGDVEIEWNYDDFVYPDCHKCHGVMKPRVVFFGENVPSATRELSLDTVRNSSGLLVVGSSLQVFSAYRLINLAKKQEIPIAILNLGPTRADAVCDFRIDYESKHILQDVLLEL